MTVFAITKDGTPHSYLSLDVDGITTAHDILMFIHGVTEALLAEKAALEASSNAIGKTNEHIFTGVGSVGLSVPEISDERLNVKAASGSDCLNDVIGK